MILKKLKMRTAKKQKVASEGATILWQEDNKFDTLSQSFSSLAVEKPKQYRVQYYSDDNW